MVVFPNAKINLGLRILRKREDGYHDIDTVFYPCPLSDILEIVSRSRYTYHKKEVEFTTTGNFVDDDPENNLCFKAYQLLKKDFPSLPPLAMHLHKVIPAGAGLGGGSSDGSFALSLLNSKFSLGIPERGLIDYALKLGSDCPFFIINKPCSANGRGEVLSQLDINFREYSIVIINPGIHISTAEAFAGINPSVPEKSCAEIVQQSPYTWKSELVNDFEKTVFEKFPEIGRIKDQLYAAGAIYAAMSGTGSSVYGIFPPGGSINPGTFPEGYFVYTKELN